MPYEKLNYIKELLKVLDEKKGLCFIDSCGEKAIGSHTISESRILEKLQERDGRHGITLLHLEDKPTVDFKQKNLSTYKNSERQLIRKGKSKSSVFYGFCIKHDRELFWNLDNEPYTDTSKINFLHAYRAFALYISKSNYQFAFLREKVLENVASINPQVSNLNPRLKQILTPLNRLPDSYIYSFEEMKPLIDRLEELIQKDIVNDRSELRQSVNRELSQLTDKTIFPISGSLFKSKIKKIIDSSGPKMKLPEQVIIDLEKSIEYSIQENNRVKSKLNSACLKVEYEEMSFLSRSINGAYKVAANFVFRTINDDLMSLTIFPEFEISKTQIIISSIGNDNTFLGQIKTMNDREYQELISSIILGQGANVFFSPSFFRNLDAEIQTKILDKKTNINKKALNIFKMNHG